MSADKKRIWISGQLVAVTDEVYAAYTKGDRKMRYFENDLKTERFLLTKDGRIEQIIPSREDSLDRLMEDNAQQFSNGQESVEDVVFRQIMVDKLHTALSQLTEKERALIQALFFEEMTEREYAEQLGVYRNAVHKKKMRILEKLKKLLEERCADPSLNGKYSEGSFLLTSRRSLTIKYPFIKHIPIAIVMSISHISGCATICGKESNEISPVCF